MATAALADDVRWYERVNWVGVSLMLVFVIGILRNPNDVWPLGAWFLGVAGSVVQDVIVHSRKRALMQRHIDGRITERTDDQ